MSDTASARLMIVNRKGLQSRASAKFARLALGFQSQILVRGEHDEVDARSMMDLLMLAAHQGSEIEVTAAGPDAADAVAAITTLIQSGFGELGDGDNTY
jgi:phosphocarrier protein